MMSKVITKAKQYPTLSVCASFILVVFIVHFPILRLGFFSDDYHMLWLVNNQGLSFVDIFTTNLIGTKTGHSYGPIYRLLFTIENYFFHLNPLGYHIISLLLHTCTSLIVFLIAKKIFNKNTIAIAAGLFFALLPVHTEAIAWVSVQPHLIATLGYVSAMYFYLQYKEKKSWKYYIFSLVSFSVGVFAKDTAITFILIPILIEVVQRKNIQSLLKFSSTVAVKLIPFIIITAIYLFMRSYTTGSASGTYASGGLTFNVDKMGYKFVELIFGTILPYPYRHIFADVIWNYSLIIPVVILGIIILGIYKSQHKKQLIWLSGTFVVMSVPFLFVSFNSLHNGGERYGYLNSTIMSIMLAFVLYMVTKNIKKQPRALVICSMVLCIVFAGVSIQKQNPWRKADNIVKTIKEQNIMLEEQAHTVFLALPDNISGAEAFRNAIFEFWELEKQQTLQGERIPLYSQLSTNENNFSISPYRLEKTIQFLSNKDRKSFTGFPTFVGETATYTLSNFELPGHLGSSINAQLHEEKIKTFQEHGTPVQLVYFDGEKLVVYDN